MRKVTKEYKQEGYVQITIADERWYIKQDERTLKNTYYPSVTWICDHYPKGIAFYKWLSQRSWDESESLKQAAGDKGSKVHIAIVDLIDGKDIGMDSKYYNEKKDDLEELTLEEWEALMSFVDWFKTEKVEVLARETVVFNEEYRYAGTIDLICKIKGKIWLIDFKTSHYIWPSHELQVSAYKNAVIGHNIDYLGILQVGYRLNKRKWKLTGIDDKFGLFLNAKAIWNNETMGVEPKKVDYPMVLTLKEV